MKTVPLNIMTSYQVKWSKQQVLRDIVQNFYDDIGAKHFSRIFKTKYNPKNHTVTISIESKGFNYEWLIHMGASTKQDKPGKFAGHFGEGFKIAALCALRDHNWKIKMRSRDWFIEVVIQSTLVDNKPLQQLAYNVREDQTVSDKTVLSIQSFSKKDADLLQDVVLGFYYKENPLFADCIFENENVAIYERSEKQNPKTIPTSYNAYGEGIIYIGFQARGSFILPLVICNHHYEIDGRDRHNIYLGTILDILIDTVDYIDARASLYLLEKLEKYWYDYPDGKSDVDSWYSLMRKLICKIAYFDFDARMDFVNRHPNLVVCKRPINMQMRNEKTQALAWKNLYLPDAHLVQDNFSLLGYNNIVDLCEKAGGFNVLRKPDADEQQLLKILESATRETIADFFPFYPDYLILWINHFT